MSLEWFRMDCHFGDNDKILALLSDPSPRRWQAAFSWVCAIGWSVDHSTDGFVPIIALPFVHGTTTTARLLVQDRGYGQLWQEKTEHGWTIVNFAQRQELSAITAGKVEARRVAAEKAACMRWHGPLCWTNGRCAVS